MQKDVGDVLMTIDVVALCSYENIAPVREINTFLVFNVLQIALRISTFNINSQLKRTKIIFIHHASITIDVSFEMPNFAFGSAIRMKY